MPMNRVQFQPGLSMSEFMSRYGSDDKCEAALLAARWPSGFVCPACGGSARTSFRRSGRLYWQCSVCQHQCSLTSGTIFESTKLPLTRWFLAMHMLTQAKNNVSALELKRHLGVSYPTAWLIKHKIMDAMRRQESSRRLTGRVEIDDAYLGGRRSGGGTGRGSPDKTAFVAAVQTTDDGKAHLACLSPRPFTRQSIRDFMDRSLALPLTVVSDGLDCFTVVAGKGADHDRNITGSGRAAAQLPKLRAVNTLLGNLKTALAGTYHAFKFTKYTQRYLAEMQFRFNHRYDLRAILSQLIRAAANGPPTSLGTIRSAEACC
jgi:transposase-like protein